jgi:hypothetical protein
MHRTDSHPRRFVSALKPIGQRTWPALLIALLWSFWLPPVSSAAASTYYVDCVNGKDANAGTSSSQAWRTIGRANKAALAPGDRLLLKRGCSWSTRLDANWTGTATQPILISAYGTGELPKIQNGLNQNVKITGSYLILEYLQVRHDPPSIDPNCNNQPLGNVYGFNFQPGAAYNLLRYSKASNETAGVHLSDGTHHIKILSNQLEQNNVMERFGNADAEQDLGAWGIKVHGHHHEIAYNSFANNNAICTYGSFKHGNSVEVFATKDSIIHHNTAHNDRVFSELGGSSTLKSADNTFAYNLHIAATPRARFISTRGGQSGWGPVWRTKVFNNTVYLTGAGSTGVTCGSGCTSDILTLKNNILWAEEKAAYADGPIIESHNLYWKSGGSPTVQFYGFSMSSDSRIGNPQFVDPGTRNFRLRATSPAINAGALLSIDIFKLDAEGTAVPRGIKPDIGTYEYPLPIKQLPSRAFIPLVSRAISW